MKRKGKSGEHLVKLMSKDKNAKVDGVFFSLKWQQKSHNIITLKNKYQYNK